MELAMPEVPSRDRSGGWMVSDKIGLELLIDRPDEREHALRQRKADTPGHDLKQKTMKP
jgi:hypothetical protein